MSIEDCDDIIEDEDMLEPDYKSQNTIEFTSSKPEEFTLSELPRFIHSDKSSYSEFNIEHRIKKYLETYPPLKDKSYCILSIDPFSYRLSDWIHEHIDSLEKWGERFFYMSNVNIKTLNKVGLFSDNRLLKVDNDGVYHFVYEECTPYKISRMNGFVFVDESYDWTADKIRNWIIKFSKVLKDFDDKSKSKIMKPNAFDGIILPHCILNDITTEIEEFLSGKELYRNDLEIPWKRGYMLIGPPGNGKTSLIRAIRDRWGLRSRDVQKAIQKDGTINLDIFTFSGNIDIMLYPPDQNPVICVMEDIDKFVVYQSGGKGNADAGKVTLHDILKALDGLDQFDGIIVIATTNYARDMSEAILNRPGRFDRIWKIDLPTEDNIIKLLKYRKIEISDGNLESVAKALKGYSMAFVAEFIIRSKTRFKRNTITNSEALTILDEIHKHNKLYLDYFKGKDDDHRDGDSTGFHP